MRMGQYYPVFGEEIVTDLAKLQPVLLEMLDQALDVMLYLFITRRAFCLQILGPLLTSLFLCAGQVSTAQIGFVERGQAHICPAEVCFSQVCSAKTGYGEVCTAEVGPDEGGISKICTAKVCL